MDEVQDMNEVDDGVRIPLPRSGSAKTKMPKTMKLVYSETCGEE